MKILPKRTKKHMKHEVYCIRCVWEVCMQITPIKTEENNLTPKLKFKAAKIKFNKQNAPLKSMFSLQFAFVEKTLIACFPPTKPISFVAQPFT